MKAKLAQKYIFHKDDLQKYGPPGHEGTVNVRLTDRNFCPNFEMVIGEIEAGGVAHRHHHVTEHQVIYILSGKAEVALGEEDSVICGPGEVIQLPPMLDHLITSIGPGKLVMVIIYSPPLAPRDDVLLD